MKPSDLGWSAWESYVNKCLGLAPTISSGNQAHDPGDGVDRRHHTETDYAIMADAKYTTQQSFSVSKKLMAQYVRRAAEAGKRFILPVRLAEPVTGWVHDYVVVPFQDYVELVEVYRKAEGGDH